MNFISQKYSKRIHEAPKLEKWEGVVVISCSLFYLATFAMVESNRIEYRLHGYLSGMRFKTFMPNFRASLILAAIYTKTVIQQC